MSSPMPPPTPRPRRFGGHLSPQWVGELVKQVLPDGYTMHTLRHRFASRAYRGTRNLLVRRKLALMAWAVDVH
jgi:hypothetical protein